MGKSCPGCARNFAISLAPEQGRRRSSYICLQGVWTGLWCAALEGLAIKRGFRRMVDGEPPWTESDPCVSSQSSPADTDAFMPVSIRLLHLHLGQGEVCVLQLQGGEF